MQSVTIVKKIYCLQKKIIYTPTNTNIATGKKTDYSERLLTVGW